MVKGLETFKEFLRDYGDSYVVIGGVACEAWFLRNQLTFRATRDIDMVLLLEGRNAAFLMRLWEFIEVHGYAASTKKDGKKTYYRFVDPESVNVPTMIELFAPVEIGFDLATDQRIIPIPVDERPPSLSAILMDEDYYDLIRTAAEVRDGLPLVGPDALIPLKAIAYLDLSDRKTKGEDIRSDDIKKHRNDVFRLAATLPGTAGPVLRERIKNDLVGFLDQFPDESVEWDAILAAVGTSIGTGVPSPSELKSALRSYFGLSEQTGP